MAATTFNVERRCSDQWDWPMQNADGVVKVTNTKDHFEVGLDAHYFTPKEIQVKAVGKDLFVNCLHEERTDQFGTISREINRTYRLPDDIKLSTLKTQLTKQGVLLVTADKE